MASSSYRPTGHLKPREVIPESQCRAIANMSEDGYGYRQTFSLLRGISPEEVTEEEIQRFGNIARSRGCGTNNHRLILTDTALAKALRKIKSFNASACVGMPQEAVSHCAGSLLEAVRQAGGQAEGSSS